MIRINLLPREERKRRQPINAKVWLGLAGAAVAGVAMVYGWFWLSGEVGRLQADIQRTQAELRRFDALAKEVDKFQNDKKLLQEKLKIIQTLMAAQRGPVRILDEVSKALPNEVWLTGFTRSGKKLDLTGLAFSAFNVATFMTNLKGASDVISNVDLVVSEKAVVEQVPVERFSITMEVKDGKS